MPGRPHENSWPKWANQSDLILLRQVGPCLFVGAEGSPTHAQAHGVRCIVDLYGDGVHPKVNDLRHQAYARVQTYRRPFLDGSKFPPGVLDKVSRLLEICMEGSVPMLIHCQAGLSRSASAAYAMLRHHHDLPEEEALRRVRVPGWEVFPRPTTLAAAEAWAKLKGQKKRKAA